MNLNKMDLAPLFSSSNSLPTPRPPSPPPPTPPPPLRYPICLPKTFPNSLMHFMNACKTLFKQKAKCILNLFSPLALAVPVLAI